MRHEYLAPLVAAAVAWGGLVEGTSQDLVISEIVAVNRGGQADVDGHFPDWIEIFNPGEAEVDLEGWYLTDSSRNLLKWPFPAVRLPAGGFLVVFASEKDRRDPGAELHTNFRLDDEGEFLALVAPDGGTIVSAFSPRFPPQVVGASYGIPMASSASTLLSEGDEASYLVPADGALGSTWTEAGFDDAGWARGPLGIGYDRQTTYDDLIATDVESAMYRNNASIYIRIPFTVGDPEAIDGLLLRMKYDDGFVAYLNGVEVARGNAPEGLGWNVRAAGSRPDSSAVIFEDTLISGHRSLLQAGVNVLAIHGLNQSPTSSDFLIVPELVATDLSEVHLEERKYFAAPTPGVPNGAGVSGVAETPRFSHESGGYAGSFSLALEVDAPDAQIRYTLDRTPPTEDADLYTDPILIDRTTVVEARTFQPDRIPSPTVTATYIILHSSAANFSSNLPIVVVNTFGRSITNAKSGPLTPVNVVFFDAEEGRIALQDPAVLASNAGMKIRGSSSQGFPKKMYALEIRDETGWERDEPLLGLPPDSDWVLYAPYSDKSLMRNVLSFAWSRWVGRYAPRTRFCEMFLNTSTTSAMRYPTQYLGVYVLMDKINRSPYRVDIQQLTNSDKKDPAISGGYIFKKDRQDPDETSFTTRRGQRLVHVYPKGMPRPDALPQRELLTTAQSTWIRNHVNAFEAALYGARFRDPDEGYAAYIDVYSFIDHHILTELAKNIDGYRLSTFFFKDREGKINAGPIWDYNLSLGNADYLQGWMTNTWYYPQLSSSDYPWWPRLFQDREFQRKYAERWCDLRRGPLALANLLGSVDQNTALLEEAQARNFQRWRILGQRVWPNWYIARTWEEELDWMRNWIIDRVFWIDSNFVDPPRVDPSGGQVDPGTEVDILGAEGTILYTINGPDPASRDGILPPEVLEYEGEPIRIEQNTRIRARARVGGAWSRLEEETFIVGTPPLVVTEIMYHPADPPAGSPYRTTDFEFIEIRNRSDVSLRLGETEFSRGVTFHFAEGDVDEVAPGGHVVVVRNREAFVTRYPDPGIRIAGEYTGSLSDSGERVQLEGPLGERILSFTYRDSWYPETDGGGHSLVIRDPMGPLSSWADQQSWRASAEVGGSPGAVDPEPPPPPQPGWQLPADANQDGSLNISDAIKLLGILFGGDDAPCGGGSLSEGGNVILLDLSGDGQVDLADAIRLLTYLFGDGPPHFLGTNCVQLSDCADVCPP